MIPRTEAELRRLIDHLGNPDAMAQWLAGILTEEEMKGCLLYTSDAADE